MTDKKLYRLVHKTARAMAVAHVQAAPDGYTVEIKPPEEPTRSGAQNDRMWSLLDDVAAQLPWRDWQGREIKMSSEEWKDFFYAVWKRGRMVMGEDGRSLVLVGTGGRTSKMKVSEMSEFHTLIEVFGEARGVVFKALPPLAEPVR